MKRLDNQSLKTVICDYLKIIYADGVKESKEFSKLIEIVDVLTLGERSEQIINHVSYNMNNIIYDYSGVDINSHVDCAYRILVSASQISSKAIAEFIFIANRLNFPKEDLNEYLFNIDLRINSKESGNKLELVKEVVKTSKNELGVFARAFEDLTRMREKYASIELDKADYEMKMLIMAYAYALRTSAAGLVGQGVWGWKELNRVKQEFQRFQEITIHTKDFQEKAADQAQELWESYDKRLKSHIVSKLTVPFLIIKPYSRPLAKDVGITYDFEELLEDDM